jgi:hypothetical protein
MYIRKKHYVLLPKTPKPPPLIEERIIIDLYNEVKVDLDISK